jgi:2-oxoisovalerate dehydrogenase E1 component beta subunit
VTDNVIVYGQDVGYFGGVFRVTEGLQTKYGKSRCFDAPISEGGIVGTAVGMGAYGLRPVVEIQFADYFYPAMDQIVSEAARLRHRSAGDFTAPITIRMPCGGGIYGGQTHSQSPEAIFTHVCGLRTVMPSNPYDAKGLLIASIENDDPVIFLEPKRIYNGPFDGHHDRPVVPWSKHEMGKVPEGYYTLPLDKAAVFRPGKAVTVLTYGTMVWVSECAARETAWTPRSSTCARSGRWTWRPWWPPSRRRAAASSCTRPRAPAALAPNWRRWCSSIASTTSKPPSSA